ncbi:MAG: hypothetical protein V4548_01280 [Bacteroidota bacterium]
MRTFLILFFFFQVNLVVSQTINNDSIQNKYFEKAISQLKNKNSSDAYNSFYSSYLANPQNVIGKIAFTKSDSLKNILRKKLLKKIQGKWRITVSIKSSSYSEITPRNDEIIIIKGLKISFYKVAKKTGRIRFIKSEQIHFNEQNNIPEYLSPYYFEIIYCDNKMWRVSQYDNQYLSYLSIISSGEIYDDGIQNYTDEGRYQMYYKRIKY